MRAKQRRKRQEKRRLQARVGGVMEVAGLKWKRVENIGRDAREGMERFDLQVKPFVVNGSITEKDSF
jgi:hypothetical protein